MVEVSIFDRKQLRRLRGRRRADCGFLAEWTEKQLSGRLQDIKRSFPLAVHWGAELGVSIHGKVFPFTADEEFLPFHNIDLFLSNLSLHSTNDLPGALIQIKRALKPDGLFLAALFGGETLHELRASLMAAEIELKGGASPRIFPFADKQQMGALMQRAGFALPVVDSEIITVTYDNIFRLMHDLRGMGESNIILQRDKKYPGREFFLKAGEYYLKNFSDPDGRIRASFEIIFLIGWAPHESQQKPLQPGSAKNRLAEALETKEVKI
ncbi:MAG: methyltransferase domain-containing protein [Alphaproteobacteria bacterium]|nr:methyltransferase domain-containing protein [Alphaproteobacteria bacterium]